MSQSPFILLFRDPTSCSVFLVRGKSVGKGVVYDSRVVLRTMNFDDVDIIFSISSGITYESTNDLLIKS